MTQDVDRLASAVVHRFAASLDAPPLRGASVSVERLAKRRAPTLLDRLASAVGQRLAHGSQFPKIEPLASAVAARLAASKGAARLASAATRHYALAGDPDRAASEALIRLAK